MAETTRGKRAAAARATERTTAPTAADEAAASKDQADEAERKLGRAVAIGLPIVTVGAAIFVGATASVGSALLVLAAGTLIGTIGLLWASVRTLSGEAPLPVGMETVADDRRMDDLAEQKRRVLRSLKDLENERAVEKIDEADYEEMAARYRAEAKVLMREMDRNVAPAVAEAERLVAAYLEKRGLGRENPAPEREPAGDERAEAPAKRACASCGTANDTDAAFCKKCGAAIGASTGARPASETKETSEDDATT